MFILTTIPTQEEYEIARQGMEDRVFTAYCFAILELIMKENKDVLERLKVV